MLSLSLLLAALLPAAVLGVACTDEENQYSFGIEQSAGLSAGCAALSTVTDTSVNINYKCSSYDCVTVLQQLEYQLPDCEDETGVNRKTALSTSLYDECNVCDYDEIDSTWSLYNAAASTDSCSPYSTVSSTYVSIYWPCSATGCSAVIADMADQLPDCYRDGENVKTYAQNLNCYGSTDDATDAPSSDGTATDTETSTPEPASGDDTTDGSWASDTTSSYSQDSCSVTQVSSMASSYYDTATSDACAADSSIISYSGYYYIYIDTLCSSDCADGLRQLDEDLPDCYYDYEYINKKEELADALTVCDSRRNRWRRRSRYLEEEASSDVISLMMVVEGEAPEGATSLGWGTADSAPAETDSSSTGATSDEANVDNIGGSGASQAFGWSFTRTVVSLALTTLVFAIGM